MTQKEWKSILNCVAKNTDCYQISKYEESFKTQKEIAKMIDESRDEYVYVIVYSNSGKRVNDYLENVLVGFQDVINHKFRDVIFFRNE